VLIALEVGVRYEAYDDLSIFYMLKSIIWNYIIDS